MSEVLRMTGYITDYSGSVYELPVLLTWDISHGVGSPCDAFDVEFGYDISMKQKLSDAIRFYAVHDGQTVFRGVVDEFEVSADGGGIVCALRGRGYAALLLDNEAESAQYSEASLEYILSRHVRPWGVTDIVYTSMPSAASFSVSAGDSQWNVLKEFCEFCGGVSPRFSKEGTLVLTGEIGASRIIDGSTAASERVYREARYGVISSVLVKRQYTSSSSTVDNGEFLARGGSCRRVISVPKSTGYDAMRYTGKYQIEKSQEESTVYELTVPSLFAAFPADIITVRDGVLELSGEYVVRESRCWGNATSAGTQLMLVPRR